MRRLLLRCAACQAVCALLSGCLTLPFRRLEQSMVFQPRRHPEGDWEPGLLGPEDAWFTSADGTRLHGWFVEAPRPRAVLLYAHGNGGNISYLPGVLRLFRDGMGCSVLAFDYRGYGRSEGGPADEAGVLADARAARRWLAARAGVPEAEIVLVGTSLGGAVMVDLAARDGARGLVLEETFTSVPDVAAHHFPLLPVRWLMSTRLDSLSKIKDYHGPLLMRHGQADRTIPFRLGRELFEAANEPKELVAEPGGDHNDPPSREFLVALDRFLSSLTSSPGR